MMKKTFRLKVAAALFCLSAGLCPAMESETQPAAMSRKAGRPLPEGIKSLAITADAKTILALTEEDLFLLNPDTLSATRTVAIKAKDGRALSAYWSAGDMVLSPDQNHVLVLDKYIAIGTGKPIATLDVAAAVKKGNPNPKALDISPDGKLGLLKVYSFSAGEFNALAIFNLETGKLIQARETGENVASAAFASDDELVVFYADGKATVEDFSGGNSVELTSDSPIIRPGNSAVLGVGTGEDRMVLAHGRSRNGEPRIVVIHPATRKVLLYEKEGSAIAWAGLNWVISQGTRTSKTLCPCGKHPMIDIFLKVKNIKTGKELEHPVHEAIDQMIYDPVRKTLLAVDYDTVVRLELPEPLVQAMGQ